ncbi:MAG: HAMP domain-containing protein, partial [Pirellulaceae bacterium]
MKKLGIRWQLTLWYSSVLAVVLTAFGTAVYLVMRHDLLERLDAGLDEELADVLNEVRRAKARSEMLVWLDRRFGQHEGFDFQVTVLEGARIFHNPRLADRRLPIPNLSARGKAVYTTTGSAEDVRWRIVNIRVPGPEGELVAQVGRSLESFDHELGELLAALLITGPATLAVAVSGGYLLARRALAPVDRMTKAAARVSAQRLDERLDVANPDDELGRLARTLNQMIERLEKSFREMQRFTTDASHELRTPIAIIRTEAEVALGKPLAQKEKQELLSDILEECQRLTWITDQLLTLSREDAGLLQSAKESVDVSALVERVVEMMRPLSDNRKHTLTCNTCGEATVLGDATRLRQVFYNLVDNAIKYT